MPQSIALVWKYPLRPATCAGADKAEGNPRVVRTSRWPSQHPIRPAVTGLASAGSRTVSHSRGVTGSTSTTAHNAQYPHTESTAPGGLRCGRPVPGNDGGMPWDEHPAQFVRPGIRFAPPCFSRSTDPEGDALSYQWPLPNQPDGINADYAESSLAKDAAAYGAAIGAAEEAFKVKEDSGDDV